MAERLVATAWGRVQGVGYREFCVRAADRLAVVGYAMNRSDRTVRVVAEGTRTALDTFVTDLERGPRMARVDRVDVEWTQATGEFGAFGVRYEGRDA
jgi:acylphosphatase